MDLHWQFINDVTSNELSKKSLTAESRAVIGLKERRDVESHNQTNYDSAPSAVTDTNKPNLPVFQLQFSFL